MHEQNYFRSPPYIPILNKYCRRHNIINAKTIEENDIIELAYYVKFKNKEKNPQFIKELDGTHGVKNISLFFDEDEI